MLKLQPTYHVTVNAKAESLIEDLQFLTDDLNNSELDISKWVVLMNDIHEFGELMAKATPDWRFTTRADFAQRYESVDDVEIFTPEGRLAFNN